MSQLSLFEPTETVLVDDASGRIVYTPHLVAAPLAERWFAELSDAVPWKAERRQMYEREVDVPRLTAHYHLAPAEPGATALPPPILQAARGVVDKTGVPFNSVGLNLYRDGRDSVAPHNDHLDAIVQGSSIALVSLGATRRMTIRAKEPPRRVLHVDLESGSLLLMTYATQLHYTHGIPKTKEPVGTRISLAFRVKPVSTGSDEGGTFYR